MPDLPDMPDSQDDKAHHLDTTGLNCPLPVLKTRRMLETLPKGAKLQVSASDPMAAIDLPHFCTTAGYTLHRQWEADGVFYFEIGK